MTISSFERVGTQLLQLLGKLLHHLGEPVALGTGDPFQTEAAGIKTAVLKP